MIVVTGATGKLGKLVVESLLSNVAASEIGVSVRDPEKARHIQQRGIRVRRGDFAEPASLDHAFEGATRLLIISSNAGA
jgi:NAD(P)H dehydrogenase (quinone)